MIETRLTRMFGIEHPVIQAPMASAAGGRLAAAVSGAGGLGLIGAGYGHRDWLEREWALAGNAHVGVGFITWSLREAMAERPSLLGEVLARKPAALFLSFDDPADFVAPVRDAGVPSIVQVQTVRDAARALELGVDVIVAQGSEAGGHGEKRATMTLVPEVCDLAQGSDTLVCAAGGIADGRGLAAALMLGADGVVVGSRFWASDEALVAPRSLEAAFEATGDDTVRSSVMDVARELDWPERYTARVLRNGFTERWHDDMDGLRADAPSQAAKWQRAWGEAMEGGPVDVANSFVGEATGLMRGKKPAGELLTEMVEDAKALLDGGWAARG